MFVDFLYELRQRGVPVGPQEAMALSEALKAGLHGSTLDGFYDVARSLCVKREQDLDAFDRAFAHHFEGVPDEALQIAEQILEWLKEPVEKRQLTDEERELLQKIDVEEARQ